MGENRHNMLRCFVTVHDAQLTPALGRNIPAYDALSGCDTVCQQLSGQSRHMQLYLERGAISETTEKKIE